MKLIKPPFKLKEIKIEVTQTCPLNCIHCSSEANPGKAQGLDKEKVLEILEDAASLGAKKVIFSGGEPLLWQPLVDVVRYSKELNLFPSIYSTGINQLEIEETNYKIAHKLKEAGLHKVAFSIYGSQPDLHELVTRIRGSFQKTTEAIKSFSKVDIKPELHFVPLKHNYKDLNNVCKLAKELKVRKVSILRFVPHGRGGLIRQIEHLEYKDHLSLQKSIKEARDEYRLQLKIRLGSPYNILLLDEHVDCLAGIDRLIISPNGSIYPCDAFKGYDIKDAYASITTHRLPEVWEKSVYLQKVRQYLTTKFPKPCEDCQQLSKCKSGCLAQKVLLNDSFCKDKDPDCLLYPSDKRREAI